MTLDKSDQHLIIELLVTPNTVIYMASFKDDSKVESSARFTSNEALRNLYFRRIMNRSLFNCQILQDICRDKDVQDLRISKTIESHGNEVIHMEIGDPNFNSPKTAKDAAINAIMNNYTHYTSSGGIDELKEASIRVTEKSRDLN